MRKGLPERVKAAGDSRRALEIEDKLIVDIFSRKAKQASLPVESIMPNPEQPRRNVGDLSELIQSVKERGILEPIIVRRAGEGYQIIAGERRYRAFLESGRSEREIPCIVVEADDYEALEISLVENLQRKDLDIWEEGETFRRMTEGIGYTQEQVAQKIGKSIGYVNERISISRLPPETKARLSKFENLPDALLAQAVRANKGGKLEEFTEMVENGKATSVANARKAADRLLDRKSGMKQEWKDFPSGRYRSSKDKRGNFLVTIKCREEETYRSVLSFLERLTAGMDEAT